MKDDFIPITTRKRKGASVLEKTRQRNIVKYLNALPQCRAEVRTQTGFGIKGGADIFGCLNGRHFELEVKQPKKHMTSLQEHEMNAWLRAGCIGGRVEDVPTTRALFAKFGIQI